MKQIPEFGPQSGDMTRGAQVVFTDGHAGIVCRQPGDRFDSAQLVNFHLTTRDSPTMMRIKTESGNNYIVSQGLAFNLGTNTVSVATVETLKPVEVGQKWTAPGGELTTPVAAVFYGFDGLREDSPTTVDFVLDGTSATRADGPSPYAQVQGMVDRTYTMHPHLGQ